MSVTVLDPQLVADGQSLALFGVSTLKSAVDTLLGKTTAEIPTLVGDSASSVIDAIEQHAPASAQGFLKFVLGLSGGAVEGIETTATTAIVGALAQTSVSVDGAFAKLSAAV